MYSFFFFLFKIIRNENYFNGGIEVDSILFELIAEIMECLSIGLEIGNDFNDLGR